MILAVCAPKPRIFIRNSAAEKTSFFSAFLHSQKQLLILMTEGFLRSYRQWNEIFCKECGLCIRWDSWCCWS